MLGQGGACADVTHALLETVSAAFSDTLHANKICILQVIFISLLNKF